MKIKKSINIIGSGLAGMFCGAILSKHGFKVNIFETRNNIGGYATCWKRKDYLFDSSLHEFNGFFPNDKKLKIFKFLGLFDRIKLIEISSCYTSLFNDDSFKVPHNYDLFIDELINKFPDEKKSIKKVMSIIKEIALEAQDFMQEKSMINKTVLLPFKYPYLIKHVFSSVYSLIWKKLKNPKLRTILAQMINYHSDNIRNMNLIYFSIPTYSFINKAFWISGTSCSLTNALKNIIEENKGKIFTNSKVTKINFLNKKAVSITVNDKQTISSDLTICNSPLVYTVKNLINKKDFPGPLRKKAMKTIPSTSLFSIYLGINYDLKKLGLNEFCYMINEVNDLDEINFNEKLIDYSKRPLVLAIFNLDDSLCPKEKTVTNICVVDNIWHWKKFRDDLKKYKEEKGRIAKLLIDRVNQKFPGFKDHIEIMEISTPVTLEKYTFNTDGAVYGACQKCNQGSVFRFPNEIKNKNLYFSNAWVNPGGGFSGVIYSAIQTTGLILEKYKIKNKTNDI